MSKIICDVCGTAYPETSAQCPICGCVRPGNARGSVKGAGDNDGKASGYTYVKGGRYSKSNVKKRAKAKVTTTGVKPVVTGNAAKGDTKNSGKNNPKSNMGLVITTVVLMLAILAVVIYIALRFFVPVTPPDQNETTENTAGTETSTVEPDLHCVGITLDTSTVVFDTLNAARVLDVTTEPRNTTDPITFVSSNEAVVTVNKDGKITAVGEGEAVITVTCGDMTAVCNVKCEIPEETTEPIEETTEPVEETTVPTEVIHLNRMDITFSYKGESWMLYDGTVAKNLITWSSDNEAVVTFENGKAVAVGSGTTNVHAEYNGEKVSCIIRCVFKEEENSGVNGSGGGIQEDG